MGRSILSVEIRTDSVCAVKVGLGLREKRVTAYTRLAIDPHAPGEDQWSAALERLSTEMDLSASNTIVSLPAGNFFFRNTQAPFREKKKIRQVLAFQMEPDMPLPVEELVFDFQFIGPPGQRNGDRLLAAFAEKRVIDGFLDTLEKLGVKPGIVTVGGYVAAAVFARFEACPPHLLFADVDNSVCTLSFVVSGAICFVRAFSVNGDTPSWSADMARHVQRSLFAFQEVEGFDFQPAALYIAGAAGMDTTGLRQAVDRRLGIPVEQVDLSRSLDPVTLPWDDGEWQAEAMGGAVALAAAEMEGLAGLNLYREGFAEKKYWREHRKKWILMACLALLAGAWAVFNLIYDVRFQRHSLDEVNLRATEIFRATFPDVTRIVDPLHQMRLRVNEARNGAVASSAGEQGQRILDILDGLSRHIPSNMDVRLTRLDVGPESVLITGDADTFNTVDEAKNRLARVPIFNTITISSTSKDRSGNRVNFKLKVQRYSEWLSD